MIAAFGGIHFSMDPLLSLLTYSRDSPQHILGQPVSQSGECQYNKGGEHWPLDPWPAVETIDLEAPASGEVTIEQTAIGLHYMNVYQRSGLYPLLLPSGLGLEAAGRVLKLVPKFQGSGSRTGRR